MAEEGGIIGIIVAIIVIAFGTGFAVLMVASTQTVFNNVVGHVPQAGDSALYNYTYGNATTAFTNTVTPIYATIPMTSLIILALIGGAIIGSLFFYLSRRG